MAGPWEKYGAQPATSAAPAAGPWAKYAQPAPQAPAQAPVSAADPFAPPSVEMQAVSAANPPPAERGWGEYLWDTANIGIDRATRGALRGVGGVVDAVNNLPRVANLLPGEQGFTRFSDRPFMGSDMLTDLVMDGNTAAMGAVQAGLEAVGAPEGVLEFDPVARDPFQRGVGRIGEEIGAATLPVMGLIGRGASMGVEAARVGGPAALAALRGGPAVPQTGVAGALNTAREAFNRNFVAPAAANPVGFAAGEVGAAAAAGTGATIANELTGNQDRSNALIDAGGALGGVGAYGVANALGRAGIDLAAALTGSERYAGEVVRNEVADQLIGASTVLGRQVTPGRSGQPIDTQELVDLLARQSDAEQLVPGFTSSTADRAGDAGIGMMEAARAAQGGGGFTARRDANSQAVDRALDARAPQENPAEFSTALGLRRDAEFDMMANTTAGVRGMYDEVATPLQPVMTASGRGADIRAALDAAATANQQQNVVPAWSPLNDAAAEMNVRPLGEAFAAADAQIPEALRDLTPRASAVPQRWAAPAPEVETGLLDEYGNAIMRQSDDTATQPLSEVMGVRTALTNDLRRDNITPQEERLIEQRLTSLDEYVKENLAPDLQAQYDAARAATRDHHDRFTRPNTAIGQTLRRTEGGGYASDDSAVPRRFVQDDQGSMDSVNSLFREAGGDERATRAVRDQILQDARDRGVLENPAQAERFLRDNSQMLSRYPELAKEFDTAAKLRGALDSAEKAERETIDRLTKPGKSAVAKYLSYGDHEAESAIRSIMGGSRAPERIDELLEFVGNDAKAVEGARAAFWKHMDSSSRARNVRAETSDGAMPIVPRKLAAFLDDETNRAVAERLYRDNPEHLADLTELATALKGVGLGPRAANAANPSGTALMMRGQGPVTMAELGSKFYQMQLGRVSPAYLAAHIAGKIASKSVGKQRAKAFENLLDKALTDPNVARELLKENNPANRAALARKVNAWRLNSLSSLLTEDDEDETVRTITMDPVDVMGED